ncbi:MAG TPA: cupin domain-containing protein [Candidatus Limnocylindrales bacterium]|jgi:quercetin dioxygenase-like cupin family protein|nr:cupin domain-containing protein [Candidatus Limnocylindrales bacterium]
MANVRDIDDVTALRVWEGVVGRPIEGERITMALVELEPNAIVPEHRHPNEQVGIVLRGGGRFRVGQEEREVRPGSTWRILADVPHEMHVGPDGAVVIDVFSPPRADWHALSTVDDWQSTWPADSAGSGPAASGSAADR